MIDDLSNQKCEACRAGSPLATAEQIDEMQPTIPDWEIIEMGDIQRLTRCFKFRNFAEALEFTHKVGTISEQQGHHPEIVTEWGKVTVTWWSHKIKGLHVNDFIMAAKTDKL